jgi:hypothetical protein
MIEQEIINEMWRSIDGCINYQVSNLGRVRNSETGVILKQVLNTTGYYQIYLYKDKKRTTIKVHKLVAQDFLTKPETRVNVEVDHIDRNALNNQATNLRYVTSSQNKMNTRKRENTTSKFKGVYFYKSRNKWRAKININGKGFHLGYFDNERDAALAYNNKAIELFDEYAFLNVIE